jgi:hypothetical protein
MIRQSAFQAALQRLSALKNKTGPDFFFQQAFIQ